MTAAEWTRVSESLRRFEDIYDDLAADAASEPSPRTFGTSNEFNPPDQGDQPEEMP
jgi:hypothetical protein